jgi:flagellar biosynthesis/type III secretory pathway M-ring protein FliF/YscJ
MQDPEPPHTSTVGYPSGAPSLGHEIPQSDWFVIWGPLGVGWLVSLLAIGFLWRALWKQREAADKATADKDLAHAAELARKDAEAKADRDKNAETFRQLAREQNDSTRQIADKYHDHAVSLRAVVESARNRIGRRE